MLIYNAVLLDSIKREKEGLDFIYSESDKLILRALLNEINQFAGTDFHYLAEIDAYNIRGIGSIVTQFISKFSSESIRGYLIPKIVFDRVPDCDAIIIESYMRFKSSDEYIAHAGQTAPAHIYTRYDKAITTLKPKRFKNDLISLIKCPRDAFYLPFTTKMVASWRIPEMMHIFIKYASSNNIIAEDVNLDDSNNNSLPPLSYIKRELRFTAIECLKYYPSANTREVILQYINDSDSDIRIAAKKALKGMKI